MATAIALIWATPGFAATPPPAITINPTSYTIRAGGTKTFSANVTNNTNHAVTWSVSGVVGGNNRLGTISATGLYTAPAKAPSPNVMKVRATSAAIAALLPALRASRVTPLVALQQD